jgi:hypothetical protein
LFIALLPGALFAAPPEIAAVRRTLPLEIYELTQDLWKS